MVPADRQHMIETTSVADIALPTAAVRPVTGMMLTCAKQWRSWRWLWRSPSLPARRSGWASVPPLVLVVVGFLAALVPGVPDYTLDPEVVLVGLLPPLLYAAAIRTSLVDVRANKQAIGILAVGAVVFTTFAVGLVAWSMIPGAAARGCPCPRRHRRAAGRRCCHHDRAPRRHAPTDRLDPRGREPGQRRHRPGHAAVRDHGHHRDRGRVAGPGRLRARRRWRPSRRTGASPPCSRSCAATSRTRCWTRRCPSSRPSSPTSPPRRSMPAACSRSS